MTDGIMNFELYVTTVRDEAYGLMGWLICNGVRAEISSREGRSRDFQVVLVEMGTAIQAGRLRDRFFMMLDAGREAR